MIQDIIEDIVGEMNANGDSFSFLDAERDFQNVEADEDIFPAVYMDPPRYLPKTVAGGGIQMTWSCLLLFVYKSELDNAPTQRRARMEKCMNAQRQFQIKLDNSDEIKSFTVGQCYPALNLFDANVDAVIMPCDIVPSEFPSVCP